MNSFSVPITKMQNDEELKELVRDPGYSVRTRVRECWLLRADGVMSLEH